MTTTEPTPEAIEELARVFEPHTPRVGANDTEFWAYCTCDPDHVYAVRTGSPASAMDAQWVRDADEAHGKHVASTVLAAGYVHGVPWDIAQDLTAENERLRAQVARVEALAATDGIWKGEKHFRLTRRDSRLGCVVTESYVTVDDLRAALDPESGS